MARANLSSEPNYYRLLVYEMERNTQAALGAPGAEGSHVGSGAKKFMFRERHDGDLKQVCEENQEVAVSQGGDRTIEGEQEPEQQQEQPPPDEPAPSPGVGPQPGRRRPRIQYSFTQRQLQELESAFQQTQYPDLQQR